MNAGTGTDVSNCRFPSGTIFPQKKRKSYTNSYKLEIVKLAESHGNRKSAKETGIEESNIREWRKRKSELESLPSNRKTKRHAKPKWSILEQALSTWYMSRKVNNLTLTTNMIKEKGVELAREMGYFNFTGSNGWVTRFLKRLEIKCKKSQENLANPRGESLNDLQNFRTFFAKRKTANEIKRRNGIICMSQVPFELEMSSPHPLQKIQFIVVLSASAAGEKLSPLVIFKGESNLTHELKEATQDLEGILIRSNDKGEMTLDLFQDWRELCWRKWVGPDCDCDTVLILDSCATHKTSEFKLEIMKQFQCQFIPPGMNHVVHPMELGVINSFKQEIYERWEKSGEIESGDTTQVEKFQNYVTICHWILKSWTGIHPNIIRNGFVQSGID